MAPPGQIRIRRARVADLEQLLALEQASFSGDRLSARRYRAHLASPRAWLGVAHGHGRLLASALVLFRSGSDLARLYSIAVARDTRGRGLGAAMLAAAERSARVRGARALRLEVRADNAAARGLYERRGYRAIGTKASYYEDGADARRYEKALSRPRGASR